MFLFSESPIPRLAYRRKIRLSERKETKTSSEPINPLEGLHFCGRVHFHQWDSGESVLCSECPASFSRFRSGKWESKILSHGLFSEFSWDKNSENWGEEPSFFVDGKNEREGNLPRPALILDSSESLVQLLCCTHARILVVNNTRTKEVFNPLGNSNKKKIIFTVFCWFFLSTTDDSYSNVGTLCAFRFVSSIFRFGEGCGTGNGRKQFYNIHLPFRLSILFLSSLSLLVLPEKNPKKRGFSVFRPERKGIWLGFGLVHFIIEICSCFLIEYRSGSPWFCFLGFLPGLRPRPFHFFLFYFSFRPKRENKETKWVNLFSSRLEIGEKENGESFSTGAHITALSIV